MTSLSLRIALAHLSRRKRQSMVSLLGVALGVGFFIGIAAMMQGFQTFFVQKVIDVSPHVEMKDEYREPPVQPAEALYHRGAIDLEGVKPETEPRGIKNGRTKALELSRLSGVEVSAVLTGQAILRYGSADVSATLVGIDPEHEREVSQIEDDLLSGSLTDLYGAANGVILGKGVAERLAVEPGDTITAISPEGVILKMKVVALYETGIITLDDFQGYALLKKVQVLQDRPNVVNSIRLRLEDVTEAESLARRIERRYGYRTESWEEANQNVLGIFIIQNAIMYSTTGAILLVAAFGIFNIISTVVLEKTKDIAILKSLGFTSLDVERIFVLEGAAVGAAGMVLGWGIGWGLIQLLESIDFEIEGFVKTQGFILHYSPWHYVISGLMALFAASLAAYLPARKAARVDPVEIIRGAA